ncbi:MAG: LCP family protein [Candidatus Magasanikbacteria bacterium]|uniref:LytR family transcriptional regulator n=1 Tax=Candidatus Magasanikbacteria bacterium CG10_big_fil_rev_8_21_14_0_10_38_6 TaxID=1974647 RepID=A0A2M6NZY9_9BACT|nr:LCP family protein [Candidatus Magasanikbacteria bacterium]NCS71868.1 LCP family protein [Candidatus Magasanikbacteria bacterium]PIR76998.1 MAG: hypothetical protein COU30_04805 [Candidatus Magasanikbacteria bacterium CG10_big_fil_rev_8_21_14_0_10_38_6]
MQQHTSVNFLPETPHIHSEELPHTPTKGRRGLFILLMVVFLFIGGCVITYAFSKSAFNSPTDYDPVTLEPKNPGNFIKRLSQLVFHKEPELAGKKDDRINILLLGMGGAGHDGPYLADTIIIVSVKPSTNQVAMISIPRDLGVDIPGYGWQKINHANAFGEANKPQWGAAFATEVIEDTFDIDIQYYGRIDFKAFGEMVDAVGGVTVEVERSFVDTEYPAPNEEYKTVSFQQGVQTMNGQTALIFARSRHGNNWEGSDYARSKRQQKIILALKEKVLSAGTILNPIRLNEIITSLDKHVTTNMEFSDMIAMLKMAKELDTSNIIRLTLDDSTEGYLKQGYSPVGAFILEPKAGSFEGINYAIAHIFDKEGDVIPPQISVVENDTPEQNLPPLPTTNIEVLNGTWVPGLAARAKKQLVDKQVIIQDIGNTNERPVPQSGIYIMSDSVSPEVVDLLKQTLSISVREGNAPSSSVREDTDILVILGEDFID